MTVVGGALREREWVERGKGRSKGRLPTFLGEKEAPVLPHTGHLDSFQQLPVTPLITSNSPHTAPSGAGLEVKV